MASGAEGPGASAGYVKEFTRHCSDVLLNLNELRHRGILTDATLAVGDARLRAHSAVLVACSGFFYSLSTRAEQHMSVSLPGHLEPGSVSLLLDFMYTSRLPLTPASAPGVLAVAAYLQMDHVADTCRDFMRLHCREKTISRHPRLELDPRVSAASVGPKGGVLPNPGPQAACRVGYELHLRSLFFFLSRLQRLFFRRVPAEPVGPLAPPRKPASEELKKEPDSPPPSPGSPARCGCQPSSPAESKTCNNTPHDGKATLDPKSRNWKKYKYIILNPLCAWPGEVPGQIDRWEARRASRRVWGADPRGAGSASHRISSPDRAPPLGPPACAQEGAANGRKLSRSAFFPDLSSTLASSRPSPSFLPALHSFGPSFVPFRHHRVTLPPDLPDGKPYRCNVCGAQFNRPANLKTHARIHSGEKPYRCDTCGARFVQVAHLRAHILIHTGEKPYPCHICGTRFRHLQTLKSHLRIHTGEKPYSCEKCELRFRHKSQLRLHLRQKHGAVTNTKVRYKVLTEPYPPVLQAC
uniref:BCL6B transcription repressor n=1 Tax=Hippocampus comes TaxID=109280 RepID=A0A3Q2YWQ7_HIPCM